MRIGIDAIPLLGARTGVGNYVEHLMKALAKSQDDEIFATAFAFRNYFRLHEKLSHMVPAGVAVGTRFAPARVMHHVWSRAEAPPLDWLISGLDVYHATNFVLPPSRRVAGIVTIHDLSFLRTPHTVQSASLRYRTLVPASVRRARIVCTPSRAIADEVCSEYRLTPDRVVVTHLGVDEEWFEAGPPSRVIRAQHKLPDRYLIFIGSREPRKDLPTLLRAYRLLLEEDPEIPRLVLAGPPGWGPVLSTSGLPRGSVITTSYLATKTLRSVVAGAACLVFPSKYEGFGLPPLEAFACGVPVVASELPVTHEVIGDLGTLFPAGDAEALAKAIRSVLDDDGGDDARTARRAHARRMTWQGCAEATRNAYQRALTG